MLCESIRCIRGCLFAFICIYVYYGIRILRTPEDPNKRQPDISIISLYTSTYTPYLFYPFSRRA